MTAPRIIAVTLHVRPSPQAVPLAAGCLFASLPEGRRQQAELLDGFADAPPERMEEAILQSDPDILVLPVYSWNHLVLVDLTNRLRRHRPKLLIVAGGPEASARPAHLLREGLADIVLLGEGEGIFSALIDRIDKGRDWKDLPGLAWREGPDVRTNPQPGPAEPEQLPSPWLTGVLDPGKYDGVLWETARGCAFGCDFCFDSGGHRQVRPLPFERLEAELQLFLERGVSQVWVLDSTFNFPPERGLKLLSLLRRSGSGIHFHLEAKADFLDQQCATLLGQLNCSVQVGLQSADADVLRRMHRPFDHDTFRQAMTWLNGEQVTFGLDLIYGLPGDDFAGFCRSLDFALGFAPNHLDIFPLSVLPGTSLERHGRDLGLAWQTEPPYQLRGSPGLPEQDLERCRELAAAVDLFYNIGRAVGVLPGLLASLEMESVEFFRGFAHWLQADMGLYPDVLLATGNWQPAEVLAMQEGFIQYLLLDGNGRSTSTNSTTGGGRIFTTALTDAVPRLNT
ncbi:MAG: radical SAM protein, partial [Deltaproteobacteria bacterium]